jgi:predicted metal-binding membrane protein
MEAQCIDVLAQSRREPLLVWPWLLVATAWGVVGLAVLTQHTDLLDHHQLMEGHVMFMAGHYMRMGGLHLPWIVALGLFLVSWQVMTAATMLPSSLPMVASFARSSRPRHHLQWGLAAFLAGYAAVWTVFGLAAFLGDALLVRMGDAWPWLSQHPGVVGAATLAFAGVYEFSALKARWLRACRASLHVMGQNDRPGAGPAWLRGLHHGAHCVGSCGALMLIMFGTDIAAVPLMVALTVVMLAQKTLRCGRRLTPLVGGVLLLLAGLELWPVAGLSMSG